MTTDPKGKLWIMYSTKVPGKMFFWHYHQRIHYDVYIETENGHVPVEVKSAAIECGAPNDPTKHPHWLAAHMPSGIDKAS